MKTNTKRYGSPGYASYITVVATGGLLTLMLMYAYKRALHSQTVQTSLQLRMDYSEKEDVILRSIVAITPNRAMRAMQNGSASAGAARDSLRWQNIFAEAILQANAGTSISATEKAAIGQASSISGNTGDSALATTSRIFTNVHGANDTVFVTPGINRTTDPGFPEALVSTNGTVNTNDLLYPIISNDKNYTGLGNREYKAINYPAINFGYSRPGAGFLAKRNWWAFSMDLANHDVNRTFSPLTRRQFVLSIYEVPSQLAISASSFVKLGTYSDGTTWKNVDISGNVFADHAKVDGGLALPGLATRTGMELGNGTTVGGKSFNGNPFTPGVREEFETTSGQFFPVSMPSESGRAAFVSINRGADFFDRHSVGNDDESNTLSSTAWNNYSSGARQCAMRLDVTQMSGTAPSQFRFEYLKGNVYAAPLYMSPVQGSSTQLPLGYAPVAVRNETVTFDYPVDLAYGKNGSYVFINNVSGEITFSDGYFGYTGTGTRSGFMRPASPFTAASGPLGRMCVKVFPERLPRFLAAIGGDDVVSNHSLVVNSDYRSNILVPKPSTPPAANDFGLILTECSDLSKFTRGFSLVTNFTLFIGSDFNTTSITPPTNYTGPEPYYPPCSLFAPHKRFGSDATPGEVDFTGQIGSLASKNKLGTGASPVDSKGIDNNLMNPDNTRINLRPIMDPADLPPVTMMNWLVVIEERRREFW